MPEGFIGAGDAYTSSSVGGMIQIMPIDSSSGLGSLDNLAEVQQQDEDLFAQMLETVINSSLADAEYGIDLSVTKAQMTTLGGKPALWLEYEFEMEGMAFNALQLMVETDSMYSVMYMEAIIPGLSEAQWMPAFRSSADTLHYV